MDPSKLLPSIKSSSAIIKSVQGGLISFDSSTKKSGVSAEKEEKKKVKYQTTLRKELLKIRSKTLKIEDILKSNLLLNKKSFNISRKQKENEKRSQTEKKLENKKTKFGNIEIPSIPQFGFLDAIKRFIFFTFLGLAVPTLIKLVPKLIDLGKNLQPMIKFLADIGKGFLNGLVTFIDWGYKIQDSTKDTFKKIGGNQAEKQFDSFVKSLNTFIDLSILAGLTALDVGIDAERYRRKLYDKDRRTRPGQQRGRVKPTTGQGGTEGLGRGVAVTSGRGGARNLGRGAAVTSGQGGAKNLGAKLSSGPFAKFAGPLKKFLGAAAPGAGAVLGALDAKARFDAGDKIGGTLAATSAALDTFAAGVGIAALATSALALTGVGAAVPAALISAAGIAQAIATGIDVVLLVRDLVRAFFPEIPMFSSGGRIKLYAKGGRIGESGRSIKVGRKIPKIVEKQQISPGKDIGGKNQILKLFPDSSPENQRATTQASPWWERWLGIGQNQTQQPKGKPANPYKALESTAKTLSKIPGPIGLLMSAGSLIPLGQKPSRDLGTSFGNMIGGLTQDVINSNINLSFGDILRFVSGYANGGDLRTANIMRENNVGEQIGSMVGRAINSMVSSQVDTAIRDIYKEISTIGKPEDRLTPITDQEFPEDQYEYEVTGGELPSLYPGRGPTTGHNYPAKDYAVEVGRSISVFVPGKVIRAGNYDPNGYGNEIIIQHENGVLSQYAHLSKINVKEGDIIEGSTVIGLTGGQPGDRGAGRTTGPHLHFELRDSRGNKITQDNSGNSYFRFGRVVSSRRRSFSSFNDMKLSGNALTGQASWYGPGFHGKKTASGETYDMNKMTAAMYRPGWGVGSNPFYAEVTNIDNGKKVRVKVNDTGPFAMHPNGSPIYPLRSHPTRIIDLSKKAMDTLGGSGVINVKVEKLGSAPRITQQQSNNQLQQPEPPGATPSSTGRPSTADQLRSIGASVQTQTRKSWNPPKDAIAFVVPGKGTYYADMKSNKIYDSNGVIVDVSGGKNKWVLQGLKSRKQTNPELFRTAASIQPSNSLSLAKVTQGLNQEPSYGDGSSNLAMVHHTTIIREAVYIPMGGGGVNNMDPSTSVLDFTPSLA
jgi:rare lipoprotein A